MFCFDYTGMLLSTGEYVTYLSMRKMLNHVTGDHDYSI